MTISVLDGNGSPQTISTIDDLLEVVALAAGQNTGNATLAAILAKLIAAPATEAGQATIAGHIDGVEAALASILAKIIAAPATEAKQDTLIGHVDGVEAALASILAKIIDAPSTATNQATIIGHVDGIETALTTLNAKDFATQTTLAALLAKVIAAPATEAKQDTEIAAINRVGTRAYGTAVTRLAYTGTSSATAAITGTEVLLHNCGTGRCFVKSGAATPAATTADIPLEPGEKFHMRITSGHMIAAIQDTTGGNLNIIPVA